MKSNKKKQPQKSRKGMKRPNSGSNPRGARPTLVLRGRFPINQNITGVNIKQINIIPTLSALGGNILDEAKNFQQYRIANVHYHIFCQNPVNYQQQTVSVQLPIIYDVPLLNTTIPLPAQSSYLCYKNVNYQTFTHDIRKSFVPQVQIGVSPNAQWVRAPKLNTADVDQLHWGHSLLFIKPGNFTSTYTLRIIVTCDVQFFHYSGNNGALVNSLKNDIRTLEDLKAYESDLYAIEQSEQQEIELPKLVRKNATTEKQPSREKDVRVLTRKQMQTQLARGCVERNPGPDSSEQPGEPEKPANRNITLKQIRLRLVLGCVEKNPGPIQGSDRKGQRLHCSPCHRSLQLAARLTNDNLLAASLAHKKNTSVRTSQMQQCCRLTRYILGPGLAYLMNPSVNLCIAGSQLQSAQTSDVESDQLEPA